MFTALREIQVSLLAAMLPGACAAKLARMTRARSVVVAFGAALVRLGYSEPCELRVLPISRTLVALQSSKQWRKHRVVLTSNQPVDVWRELCWRYLVYPGRYDGLDVDVVFAVYLRPRRPPVRAAIVDTATGATLPPPSALPLSTLPPSTQPAPAQPVSVRPARPLPPSVEPISRWTALSLAPGPRPWFPGRLPRLQPRRPAFPRRRPATPPSIPQWDSSRLPCLTTPRASRVGTLPGEPIPPDRPRPQ